MGCFQANRNESEPSIRYRQPHVCDPFAAVWGESDIAAGVGEPVPHHSVWVAEECRTIGVHYEGKKH